MYCSVFSFIPLATELCYPVTYHRTHLLLLVYRDPSLYRGVESNLPRGRFYNRNYSFDQVSSVENRIGSTENKGRALPAGSTVPFALNTY